MFQVPAGSPAGSVRWREESRQQKKTRKVKGLHSGKESSGKELRTGADWAEPGRNGLGVRAGTPDIHYGHWIPQPLGAKKKTRSRWPNWDGSCRRGDRNRSRACGLLVHWTASGRDRRDQRQNGDQT